MRTPTPLSEIETDILAEAVEQANDSRSEIEIAREIASKAGGCVLADDYTNPEDIIRWLDWMRLHKGQSIQTSNYDNHTYFLPPGLLHIAKTTPALAPLSQPVHTVKLGLWEHSDESDVSKARRLLGLQSTDQVVFVDTFSGEIHFSKQLVSIIESDSPVVVDSGYDQGFLLVMPSSTSAAALASKKHPTDITCDEDED